jgi:outer membrane lipoprotein-sorting protein
MNSALTRRRVLSLLPPLFGLALAPRWAMAALSPQDQTAIKQVQDYLNNIHTLQSRFAQIAGDGGVANGTLYLSRPGHMRIDYDPPVSILLVADQGKIWYYDRKLEQISWVDIDDTPAWFLLKDNLSLGGDITVTKLDRSPGALRISLVETKKPDIGRATLVLSEQPMELRKWQIIDAAQKTVDVALDDPHYGVALNPNLFMWTDPRPGR